MISENLFGDKTYVVKNLFSMYEKEGYELSLQKHDYHQFKLTVKNKYNDKGVIIAFSIPTGTYINDKWIQKTEITFENAISEIYSQLEYAKKTISGD